MSEPMKVFIAEDEEMIRKLYEIQFQRAGHQVTSTVDGYSAVSMLNDLTETPDLLLLDMGLPGLDGKTVFEEAAKIFGDIPTIFCSGTYAEDVDVEYRKLHPKTALLIKPVSVKTILETAEKLINN
jgi:DNA-binding response OmpR family regulator